MIEQHRNPQQNHRLSFGTQTTGKLTRPELPPIPAHAAACWRDGVFTGVIPCFLSLVSWVRCNHRTLLKSSAQEEK